MKSLFGTVPAILALSISAAGADSPSVAGKWQIHTSIAGNENDLVCTFNPKDDSSLAGNCSNEQGSYAITGTVKGSQVKWSYKSEYNGTPLTVNYEGATNSEGAMKGTVEVPEFSVSGDFTARQSK